MTILETIKALGPVEPAGLLAWCQMQRRCSGWDLPGTKADLERALAGLQAEGKARLTDEGWEAVERKESLF